MYPVWYGTNRHPAAIGNSSDTDYSAARDSVIHFGKAMVYIPVGHHFGSTGSAWYRRVFNGDDPLSLKSVTPLSEADFYTDLRGKLSGGEGTLLVYIHGYHVTFDEAAIRAAQIGYDLDVDGATAFFSWPSQGSLEGYGADEASVEAAEGLLADFIASIATTSHAKQVHIIAHSMGNLGLLRALNRATTQAALKGVKFGQIILAAPDVDADLFRQLASVYPSISQRTTLYVSGRDKALDASHWLRAGAPRAGYTPPVMSVKGIDTVDVTNIDLGLLGHGYYAEATDVLHDMYDLMQHNDPPERRIRLKAESSSEGQTYWVIGK
jgi:esterase/lipase superfamily enzyme